MNFKTLKEGDVVCQSDSHITVYEILRNFLQENFMEEVLDQCPCSFDIPISKRQDELYFSDLVINMLDDISDYCGLNMDYEINYNPSKNIPHRVVLESISEWSKYHGDKITF